MKINLRKTKKFNNKSFYSLIMFKFKGIESGNKVRVVADRIYEGILMPIEDERSIFIKLSSGYNIGIDKEKIKDVKIIEKRQEKEIRQEKRQIVENKDLPKITILHVGGTIASKVDYETGAVKALFSPEDIIDMFPEIKNYANIDSKIIGNILSENIRFSHYNIIAKEIEKQIGNGADGIIITHGTDTLHYTSAALSFILENLNIPIILVGAQRSSDRPSSDSAINLINAIYFISKTDFSGVAICMHKTIDDEDAVILPACKSRKLHSSRRDAFKPVNDSIIAEVNYKKDYIKFSDEYKNKITKKDKSKKPTLKLFDEKLKIAIIKAHPNMLLEEINNYKNFDGIIIEGTGLGHMPIEKMDDFTDENEMIFNEIKTLASKIPVVMTTQTIYGRVNMNVYSTARKLKQIGVLGDGLDMTTETAFIKLAWLISNKMDVKENIGKNFRGEINDRILEKQKFEGFK